MNRAIEKIERERESEEGGESVGGLHGVEAIGVWRARR